MYGGRAVLVALARAALILLGRTLPLRPDQDPKPVG